MKRILRLLTSLGVATAHPIAFAVVAVYVIAWLFFGHQSFDWVSGATVATLFMTLFIQRAEHRDTQAIHAKLDELLRVESRARNELMQLDQQEPEKIEAHREKEFHSSNASRAGVSWPRGPESDGQQHRVSDLTKQELPPKNPPAPSVTRRHLGTRRPIMPRGG